MSTSAAEHGRNHVLPITTYLLVYASLLVLTGLTVGVSYANLGQIAIYVALSIAAIKALLVVGYFMHLKYSDRFYSLVFGGSVLFLLIFFGLVMSDLATRGLVLPVKDNFVPAAERAAAADSKAAVPPTGK
ncbi:MAG: cytochrome C oxidase subunit IV family protein [Candidatus Schekmanbacteria bacterium]|nr:cytochrome C oxidase subunit IV family protein [Candidatus Schekmanbacteria bacterium]